jgi:hypothetical protein
MADSDLCLDDGILVLGLFFVRLQKVKWMLMISKKSQA